jgi:hypothetical protein
MLGWDDDFQVDNDDEVPDAVLARLTPRKANKWYFLSIGIEWVNSMLEVTAESLNELGILISQRASYEDDRQRWSEGVGYEIEKVDDFLRQQELEEIDDACAD